MKKGVNVRPVILSTLIILVWIKSGFSLINGYLFSRLFAIVLIIAGVYLWKGKNWARIVVIIVLILQLLLNTLEVFAIMSGEAVIPEFGIARILVLILPTILINLLVILYLTFSKEVKKYLKVGGFFK